MDRESAVSGRIAGSMGNFGVLGQIGPLGNLALTESVKGLPVVALGSDTINGQATTRYAVSLPTCLAMTHSRGLRTSAGPTELWIDGRGRLVQVTVTTHEDVSKGFFTGSHVPGNLANVSARFPTGRSTTSQTLRLYDYGTPVSITAPSVRSAASWSGRGLVELRRRACTS
jgi:hypothetical protein